MEKKEELVLRTMLNFDAHHKELKIFCVAHTITKNQIFGILSLFNYIIFTNSPSNGPVLRSTLRYFKIEKDFVENWINKFKAYQNKSRTSYFFFECIKMEFWSAENIFYSSTFRLEGQLNEFNQHNSLPPNEILPTFDKAQIKNKSLRHVSSASTPEKSSDSILHPTLNTNSFNQVNNDTIELLEKKFERFVANHPHKGLAGNLFEIIIHSINLDLVNKSDLSVNFKTKVSSSKTSKNEKKVGPKKISLIDYVMVVINSTKKPSTDIIVLHNYIKSFCVVPDILILNKYLQ